MLDRNCIHGERLFTKQEHFNGTRGDAKGPWNSRDGWDRVDDLEEVMPADGGDGTATVKLAAKDMKVVAKMGERTLSDPSSDPTTGADLGAGPGAGRTRNGIWAARPISRRRRQRRKL